MRMTESSRTASPLIAQPVLPAEAVSSLPDPAGPLEQALGRCRRTHLSTPQQAHGFSHQLGHGNLASGRLSVEPELVLLVERDDRANEAGRGVSTAISHGS